MASSSTSLVFGRWTFNYLSHIVAILLLCSHSCQPHPEGGHAGDDGAVHSGGDGGDGSARGTTIPLLHKGWVCVTIERRKCHYL